MLQPPIYEEGWTMKYVIIFSAAVMLFSNAHAAEPAKPADKPANKSTAGVVVQKVENESTLRRMFDETWAKLRSYGPRLTTGEASRGGATIVAGVRGAESTGSQLKPYWKGDRTSDPAYVQEANAYNQAQALAEAGDNDKAAAGFEEFLKTYPKSSFKPNAQFALGLTYGAAGQKVKSKTALDGFIKDYPAHPMVVDAKRVNEALR